MKKTLAILATVATVAATTVTAPAQARGIGPGLAVGLAAGAVAAGAAGAYGYHRATDITDTVRAIAGRLIRPIMVPVTRSTAGILAASLLAALLVRRRARNSLPGFSLTANRLQMMGVKSPVPHLSQFLNGEADGRHSRKLPGHLA